MTLQMSGQLTPMLKALAAINNLVFHPQSQMIPKFSFPSYQMMPWCTYQLTFQKAILLLPYTHILQMPLKGQIYTHAYTAS